MNRALNVVRSLGGERLLQIRSRLLTLSNVHYRLFTQQQTITENKIGDLNEKTFCRNLFNDIPSDLKQLPDDIYQTISEVQEKSGFIPTIFLILARRPEEFRSFFSYYDALMKSKNSELTIFEKEMIVVATSSYNKCLYCVVAHGAMLRVFAKKENVEHYNMISDQVATDYRKADISDKQKAMLSYAVKLAMTPYEVTQSDFDDLRSHGFSKEAIWDIGAITALFSASNRIAHMSGLMPNHEFYEIGRKK